MNNLQMSKLYKKFPMNRNIINLLYNIVEQEYHKDIKIPELEKFLDLIIKNGYTYISNIPIKNTFERKYKVFSKEGESILKIFYFKQSSLITDLNIFSEKIKIYKQLESKNLSPKILNYGITKYTKKMPLLKKLLFGRKDIEVPSFGYIEYRNFGKNLHILLRNEMKITEINLITKLIHDLLISDITHGNMSIKNMIYDNGKIYLINPISRKKYNPNLNILQFLYSLYKNQKIIRSDNFRYLSIYFSNLFTKLYNMPSYQDMVEYYGKMNMKTFFRILLDEI